MIPHQLHIKNFLSYGPDTQIIDFSNYHLICLSGKNGHGKSAMLDAITWAIWGQARKSSGNSKPDAGLLHLGQKHMMVILEFEVNGQYYRVRREYLNTASKPFATLDFGVKSTDGKLTALTDKTIKDTQEKIERTIGITYESFTNSTFLRQGQSNEFSKKSPKERKDILAQILQLQKFEDQKKIAQQHARKLNQDFIIQSGIKERIEEELKSLACVPELAAIANQKLTDNQTERTILAQEKIRLDIEFQNLNKLLNQQTVLTHQYHDTQALITKTKKEIEIIQEFLNKKSVGINTAELKEQESFLLQEVHRLQLAHQKKLELKEVYLSTKEQLNDSTTKIKLIYQQKRQLLDVEKTKHQEALNYQIKQLAIEEKTAEIQQAELVEIEEKIVILKKSLEVLQDSKNNFFATQQQTENKKNEYQRLQAQTNQLTFQIKQINHEQEEICNKQNSACMRCMQTISMDQQQKIVHELIKTRDDIKNELSTLKNAIQIIESELIELQKNEIKLTQDCQLFIQEETKVQSYINQYEKLKSQFINQTVIIKNLHNQTQLLHNQICLTEENLTKINQEEHLNLQSEYIQDLSKKLFLVEQEGKKLNFQIADLQNAEQKLKEVSQLLAEHKASTDTSARNLKEQELAHMQKNILIALQQIDSITTNLNAFENIDQIKQNLTMQEANYIQKLQVLESEQKALLIEKGSLQQKEKKIIDLQHEKEALEINLKAVKQELSDYQEIAKALGKDGIQALLIEQAIPEIEYETNQILSRLTNNQTQIFIESLRDLKKGGSKETLDIKISDSFGLRDYEMFSGGEAFRIDFALRIGISKLLARRAGTTLQTIFIDEGFGSQDEEGLQLIMDNLYKIQDDFAKIIIVSHLPEMKEQFPVQFIVEKKRCGSTVAVVHQG